MFNRTKMEWIPEITAALVALIGMILVFITMACGVMLIFDFLYAIVDLILSAAQWIKRH